MRSDGSGLRRLTDTLTPEDHPDWSPDGSMIAFTAERGGNRDVYIMGVDGGGEWRLTG